MIDKKKVQKYLRPLLPRPTFFTPQGALRQKIRGILFDIYGTLFISGSGDINPAAEFSPQIEQLRQLLAEYGICKTPRALLDEYHQAITAGHMELRAKGVDFPEIDIERIWLQVLTPDATDIVRQFAVEFELIVNPVYPMPNLAKLLDACRNQGIVMGIISNAQFYTPYLFQWFLDSGVKELGIDPDLIFYSYRFKIAKPSSVLFRMAAEKLHGKGIPASRVLYLGNDMLNDIYPAKATGFQTALFAGDERSLRLRSDDYRCRNLTADLLITDLAQLLPFVASSTDLRCPQPDAE